MSYLGCIYREAFEPYGVWNKRAWEKAEELEKLYHVSIRMKFDNYSNPTKAMFWSVL